MGFRDRLRDSLWSLKKNRTAQIALAIVLLLVVAGSVGAWAVQQGKNPKPELTVRNGDKNPRRVEQVRRRLDGVFVARGEEAYTARTVVVENLAIGSVRPQAGLSQASVVYEATVEGGITRLVAVFDWGETVPEIAPVRSARPYLVDIAQEYGGIFAHAGGSLQALDDLKKAEHLVNLDEISLDSRYFSRDGQRTPPHNLRTTTNLLLFAERDKKVPNTADFPSWTYKDDAVLSQRPEKKKKIIVDFSTKNYLVEWNYNPQTNRFARSVAGVAQVDRNNQKPIEVANVIVQFVKTTSPDGRLLAMETLGEGGALVFRDGELVNATWVKNAETDRTQFMDDEGNPVALNAGPTWIEFLPTDREVDFQ